MNSELFEALDMLEKEKGISKDYMLERVEAALISAYKRDRNGLANVRVEINKDKQDIKMFEQKTIVEEVGDPELEDRACRRAQDQPQVHARRYL